MRPLVIGLVWLVGGEILEGRVIAIIWQEGVKGNLRVQVLVGWGIGMFIRVMAVFMRVMLIFMSWMARLETRWTRLGTRTPHLGTRMSNMRIKYSNKSPYHHLNNSFNTCITIICKI